MYQFGGDEDPKGRGDFIITISPPRLRLKFCNSDTYVYCDIDPHLYLVVAMVIVLLQIHNVCLVAALIMIHSYHGSTLYVWWLHLS